MDPKPKQVENTLEERNYKTTSQSKYDCCDTPTPPLPPQGYSLSSSLENIDNYENIALQDLSSQSQQQQNPKTNNESTYQPLILPRPSGDGNTASEYQSLIQMTQCKNSQSKGNFQTGQEID